MQLSCPDCESELANSGELKRHCPSCNSDFVVNVCCRECGQPLQRLKACGAVSFWCDHCNELKSKSTAIYNLVKQA
ncbi:zinc ribbon domain-containing protein [Vibrio sp. 1-Bac 57]|uniref:zinc ribbon domain-containing protein n=1 Tax=Psychromonas sp. SA13A TaxID=2686346 RepID=UPI00140E3326|nr:zinc ribbon domain-containing protein [Psychromonas sp. SA13A]